MALVPRLTSLRGLLYFSGVAAAVHAFIVGVSAYRHLPEPGSGTQQKAYGLEQLTSAARSAARVRDWLLGAAERLPRPLGSVHTLLSPSPGEIDEVGRYDGPADLGTVLEHAATWRQECSDDPENIAFCYVAGHGVQQTQRKVALLLEDFLAFAGNPLHHALDLASLHDGMAPATLHPRIARNQLWCFDTCRVLPGSLSGYETRDATKPFLAELGPRDDRCAPAFYASVPGASAWAEPDGLTLFSQALLRCLNGAAGRQGPDTLGEWEITVDSLAAAMPQVLEALLPYPLADQLTSLEGPITRPRRRIVVAPGVPEVSVSLALRPKRAARAVTLHVRDFDGDTRDLPSPLAPNPYTDTWPAGYYTLSASPSDCGVQRQPLPVIPPSVAWTGDVTHNMKLEDSP